MCSLRKSCWFHPQHIYVYIKYILKMAIFLTPVAVWQLGSPAFFTWVTAKLPERDSGPWSSLLNKEAGSFLKHKPLYSSSQKPARMPHVTPHKSESPPGLYDWIPTTPARSLQSHPLPCPRTHSSNHVSLCGPLPTPEMLPPLGLCSGYSCCLGIFFSWVSIWLTSSSPLLFRCYILNRSIQATNLIWQFIGFQYPDTLMCSIVSFFLGFISLSALYNFFIIRFIVCLPSGRCKLHETMGVSLPWFYFSNNWVVWI